MSEGVGGWGMEVGGAGSRGGEKSGDESWARCERRRLHCGWGFEGEGRGRWRVGGSESGLTQETTAPMVGGGALAATWVLWVVGGGM